MSDVSASQGKLLNGQSFAQIVNSLVVLVVSGWCFLIAALPLTLVLLLLPVAKYWPMYCVAIALSAPAIAALYAVYRDHPALFSHNRIVRERVLASMEESHRVLPEWIAQPYVPSNVMVRVVRPYLRAWVKVAIRSLVVGVTYSALAFVFLYDVQIMLRLQPYGLIAVPVLLLLAMLSMQAMLIALTLVVEYPQARIISLLRNGILLSLHRVWALLAVGVVVCAYWWGVMSSPLLVLGLATGLLMYMIWAAVQWQAGRLREALAIESGDADIMTMYGVPTDRSVNSSHTSSKIKSLFRGTTDYMQ